MAHQTTHAPDSHVRLADELVDEAIATVERWLHDAAELATRDDKETLGQLRDLILDEQGVEFVMQFVDRVARPEHDRVAAAQLKSLVSQNQLPAFLSPIDKVLLRTGSRLATHIPAVVMPLARRRMRSIVGHLVAPAESSALSKHLDRQRGSGYQMNVNLLGEAVLGEREAQARLCRLQTLLQQPHIDYVSVKVSAVASQLNHWDYAGSLVRVIGRIEELVQAASATVPATFVNFDMEEYHDLHLTVDAFKAVLGKAEHRHLDAGIVLQAYLPDVFDILRDLVRWSNKRHGEGGGSVKVRLVKGANLAMETVDAAIHNWPQAPYASKVETDASYRRCIDWALRPERTTGVKIGIASHNLFDVAWTHLLAVERGVPDRVQFEMLQGMAPAHAKAVNAATCGSSSMLMYTPVVAEDDFDVAIGYLFRRLEENAAPENFMRSLLDLQPDSPEFKRQADIFREGVRRRNTIDTTPRRTQDRTKSLPQTDAAEMFQNEPDTDPSLPQNRAWIAEIVARPRQDCTIPVLESIAQLDRHLDVAANAAPAWSATPANLRREILHRVAEELACRRGELISTMMHEASKTIAQADVEVSEAIDFARWYGDRALELEAVRGATFKPFGVIAVIPPWNFPTAIAAGGVLAALAAGNSVLLKPAPQTPRCAELVAEACWAAGVSKETLQVVRAPENEIGRRLVEEVDGVVLTGSSETADLFRSWKPSLRLRAEASGKNVLIITASADLDLAAQDLIQSAFGHAGQKCSAASLAILVGDVAQSKRFRRQLVDAAQSLGLGSPHDLGTDIAPLVDGGNERLTTAATSLQAGESWLLEPTMDGDFMSPGIREGVTPGCWFHTTECFGPILGLMHSPTLEEAIAMANSSAFGLTGGIHSLDPSEVQTWTDTIQVGNAYVNRPITGAIVQRQPFGGWKRSSVGPGAKAGGVNYLMHLGSWSPVKGPDDYDQQWAEHFGRRHDATALDCEANIFRYRSLGALGLWAHQRAEETDIDAIKRLSQISGTALMTPKAGQSLATFIPIAAARGVERIRLVAHSPTSEEYRAAAEAGIHLIDQPVTPSGRVELQHFLLEQSLSMTMHRFGNLTASWSVEALLSPSDGSRPQP